MIIKIHLLPQHHRGQDGLDGIALAKLAQLLHPFIRVIFVTGYAFGPLERAMGSAEARLQ